MRELAKFPIILAAVIAGVLTGGSTAWAAPYTATEQQASKYSLENAKVWVEQAFQCNPDTGIRAQVMPDIVIMSWPGFFTVVEFRDMNNITVSTRGFWQDRMPATYELRLSGHVFQNGKTYGSYDTGECRSFTEGAADALLRLKMEYDRTHNPQDMEKFKEEALRYNAMDPKPQIPEDARRFRVQAEAAVAAKRFMEAADKYGKAIEVAPWWPEAHFNRGVVLAELQNFDSAILEMKRYLILKPDAADARQAQDFIYAWEAHPFEKK